MCSTQVKHLFRICSFIFFVSSVGLNKNLGSQQKLNVDSMLTYFEIILRRNVISTLNQRHVVNVDSTLKLTLKQRSHCVDTKRSFFDNLQC